MQMKSAAGLGRGYIISSFNDCKDRINSGLRQPDPISGIDRAGIDNFFVGCESQLNMMDDMGIDTSSYKKSLGELEEKYQQVFGEPRREFPKGSQ